MHVLSIYDLDYKESVHALKRMRQSCFPDDFTSPSPQPSPVPTSPSTSTDASDASKSESGQSTDEDTQHDGSNKAAANAKKRDIFSEIVAKVGGRLGYLNKVARHKDMHEMADHLLSVEKASLLSQIGLIADHDDDVMDEVRTTFSHVFLFNFFVPSGCLCFHYYRFCVFDH